MISMLVSGGQTGADRAALDLALELGLPHGGWVPLGRRAEDGVIAAKYEGLVDSGSPDNDVRTRLNARDSDGTVLITHGAPARGSLVTQHAAEALNRPFLHLDLDVIDPGIAAARLSAWLSQHQIQKLNVAGPRASESPGIYEETLTVLRAVLAPR